MEENQRKKKLAEALGASRVEPMGMKNIHGPLGFLALREEMKNRLRSIGGRPTDPLWKERRCVPFTPEIWEKLKKLAVQMSTEERKVTPAQVAAMIIEKGLENNDEKIDLLEEVPEAKAFCKDVIENVND